ncbi:MAG: transposase [Phycisphaera sp. RhM]|nr:transposase [Phycisphaera sp. RhM]
MQSVLAKTSVCRTRALGGRWYECDDCQGITKVYNSCGDRASQLLLDGVDYYQVIFTLPEILSTMALANRNELADLLFQSAWKALKKSIGTEQGYDPATLMVLHTWNQKLKEHWHVHALVPGGGPSLKDQSWTEATPPPMENPPQKYLVDAINLRTSFRKFAIAKLQRLWRAGKLSFGGSLSYLREDDAWDGMIKDLESVEWVSHIEGPRCDESRPEHVVRYLTRYLTGGPISDYRITAADSESVTFLAREGRTTGGEDVQVPCTLPRDEFVRRWCLHIQSDQLTKTRYFGGWSNTRKDGYLERCALALDDAGVGVETEIDFDVKSIEASESEFVGDTSEGDSGLVCEHCGSESLTLIDEIDKPSWTDVFRVGNEACPDWYRESLDLDDRRFWDDAMGEGFSDWYDWYLKSEEESAKELELEPDSAPAQLEFAWD